MPAPSLESALVRILRAEGELRRPVGAGFLVSPQHIVTCAHVVNCALGRGQNSTDRPDTPIFVDFPLLNTRTLVQADVLHWHPVKANASVGDISDIAVLELQPDIPLPIDLQPAPILALESYSSSREVKMCGFPFGVTHGTYAKGSPQGLNEKGWVEIHHLGNEIVEQGFSGTAAWATEDNAVCGMIVGILKRKHSVVAYMIPAAVLFKAFPDMPIPVNPYRGLEVFREQDARFYFGRDEAVARLRKTVEKQPFTAVIGASGSGKSSLVFAGLVPSLQQSDDWLIADCRPKKDPFLELAASLFPFLYDAESDELERIRKTKQSAAALLSGELNLSDLIRRIAEKNDRRRFLLIIDQFEELYSPNADKDLVRSFISQVLEAAQIGFFSAVITLRADFMSTAASCGVFAEALNSSQPVFISAVENNELRQMVEQPAALQYVAFEHGLAELIVSELDNEPGNLPLLEFCLTQLWEKQQCRQITHAAYQDIGGVQHAVAVHADEMYGLFNAKDKERVRHIFLKLVRPGQGTEDTRQAATFEEFKPEYHGVIKKLADWRLLVTGQDAESRERTVEVVHEALIRHWTTLREWVDQEREFLLWRENLKMRWRQWCESSQDEGALLRGVPLDQALTWQKIHQEYLSDELVHFINESEQLREREEKSAEEARQEKERLFQETRLNLAKAFEEKAITALKTAKEEGTEAYKKAILFASTSMDTGLEQNKCSLKPHSIGMLFDVEVFHVASAELWVSPKHESEVKSISYSSDGKLLASVSHKSLQLWDVETGRKKIVLQDGGGRSVSFSPDSKMLAVASGNTVHLWNMESGERITNNLIQQIYHQPATINEVSFSPDGKLIACTNDRTIQVRDSLTRKELTTLYYGDYQKYSLSFSPDSSKIAFDDDRKIKIYDIKKDEITHTLYGDEGQIHTLSFSPDGKRLASAGQGAYEAPGNVLRIWDIETSKTLNILSGHKTTINTVAFSSDGERIVSGSDDRTVRIWHCNTGDVINILQGHKSSIKSVSFSPDGKYVASASGDGTIRIWDTKTNQAVKMMKGYFIPRSHSDSVRRVAFSPDGRLIASAGDDKTHIWNVNTGKPFTILEGDFPSCHCITFSPDGKRLASASAYDDIKIPIWDCATGKQLNVLKGHSNYIDSLSFHPDGKRLASVSSDDGTVRIWDIINHSPFPLKLLKYNDRVLANCCLLFSPDGKWLALTSGGGWIQILDGDTGNELTTLEKYTAVSSGSFSPDGKYFAAAFHDQKIRVFSVDTWEEVNVLEGERYISFGPDSNLLISAYNEISNNYYTSNEWIVRLWNSVAGTELALFRLKGHTSYVENASFSPDCRQLASGAHDKKVLLWDISLYTLFLHNSNPTPLYHTFIEAVKFLWKLDVQGLEIVETKRRTPADLKKYGALLAPPPPGQSKFDQVLEWAEKQQENAKQTP